MSAALPLFLCPRVVEAGAEAGAEVEVGGADSDDDSEPMLTVLEASVAGPARAPVLGRSSRTAAMDLLLQRAQARRKEREAAKTTA